MSEIAKTDLLTGQITEGLTTRLRRLRVAIDAFGHELDALKRIEATMKAAADRLDKGAGLIGLEAQLLEVLVHRDPEGGVTPVVAQLEKRISALQEEHPTGKPSLAAVPSLVEDGSTPGRRSIEGEKT